ncbi:hypothetical protein ABL78_7809 [Leptomonas seymouri]|uniref:Uncharacterized protein n=1 Tax=Leptomonas seymouri TaxID=5684 RepID=A0A0N1HRW4_LEPSE|nr:hypothetical protein ABL78_7809 [Leptomonas seymouri]|eukprot:KPI83165.1 hypothetical protein ABL78_7809 [Leptomonas seymouri]
MHSKPAHPLQGLPAANGALWSTAPPLLSASLLQCRGTPEEAAVIHASTYALLEQLYSASSTSFSVERLMYLRTTTTSGSSSNKGTPSPQKTDAVAGGRLPGVGPGRGAPQASTWVAVLFPAVVPTPAATVPLPSASTAKAANVSPPSPLQVPSPPAVDACEGQQFQRTETPPHEETVVATVTSALLLKGPGSASFNTGTAAAAAPVKPNEASVQAEGVLVQLPQNALCGFPPSPLPLTSSNRGTPTTVLSTAARTHTASANAIPEKDALAKSPRRPSVPISVDPVSENLACEKNDSLVSVVLRPQSRDCRRTAVGASLTPGTVSSPPDWVLPASTSEVVPHVSPLPRVHPSLLETLTLAATSAPIALAAETTMESCEGDALKEPRPTPEVGMPAPDADSTTGPVPVCFSASSMRHTEDDSEKTGGHAAEHDTTKASLLVPRLSTCPTQASVEGEPELPKPPQAPPQHSCQPLEMELAAQTLVDEHADEKAEGAAAGAADNGDDDEATGFISLRTSPIVKASRSAIPDSSSLLAAVALHHDQDRGSTLVASSNSASPFADRDGLVFSPPRQQQMRLRLQRRRRREPSEGSTSSASVSPRSPAMQASLSFLRSTSSTPALTVGDDTFNMNVKDTNTVRHAGAEEEVEWAPDEMPTQKEDAERKDHATSSEGSLPPPPPHARSPSPAPSEKSVAAMPHTEPAADDVMKPIYSADKERHNGPPETPQDEMSSDALASSASAPQTPVHVEDARVVDNDDEHTEEIMILEEQQPPGAAPSWVEGRSPHRRSECSCETGMSGTPSHVRYTAAAAPAARGTADPREDRVESERMPLPDREKSTDNAVTYQSPSTPSVSPTPRRTSSLQEATHQRVHLARRTISMQDFTWAEEADEALRRQQQRLYSQSLTKGGHSPSLKSSWADGRPTETGVLVGPQAYHPLPEGSIGLRQLSMCREGLCRETSVSPAWRASPQPQDPQARFCPLAPAATAPRSAPQSREWCAAPGGVALKGFASPMQISPSPPPSFQLQAHCSSLPVSLSTAGVKRARSHQTSEGDAQATAETELSGVTVGPHRSFNSGQDASPSPLPTHQVPADKDGERGAAGAPRATRTHCGRRAGKTSTTHPRTHINHRSNNRAHRGEQPSSNTVHGGGATMRRKQARLNASSTVSPTTTASALNEFVLPRAVSAEPVPSASVARAASPLQPRSVNHLHHHSELSSSAITTEKGTLKSSHAPSTQRKCPKKEAAARAGQGDRSVKRAAAPRKPSLVALKQKRQRLQSSEGEGELSQHSQL